MLNLIFLLFPVLLNDYLFYPPKKVYWQVASNIFPKARITSFFNPFLPSSHKKSNRNSHPTPSWKLRESASETSSDYGTNRKRQYGVTVWQKKPDLTWQWRQAMTQLSQILQEVCEHAQFNTLDSSLKYDSLPESRSYHLKQVIINDIIQSTGSS